VPAEAQQTSLTLDLPDGVYKASWMNTKSGEIDDSEEFRHEGGARTLSSPSYTEDIALLVRRASP
jgi:hypothetical protein